MRQAACCGWSANITAVTAQRGFHSKGPLRAHSRSTAGQCNMVKVHAQGKLAQWMLLVERAPWGDGSKQTFSDARFSSIGLLRECYEGRGAGTWEMTPSLPTDKYERTRDTRLAEEVYREQSRNNVGSQLLLLLLALRSRCPTGAPRSRPCGSSRGCPRISRSPHDRAFFFFTSLTILESVTQ